MQKMLLQVLNAKKHFKKRILTDAESREFLLKKSRWKRRNHSQDADTNFMHVSRFPSSLPRAWGRLRRGFRGIRRCRNTPTGVGKTLWLFGKFPHREKHPHGRGEDGLLLKASSSGVETPPRAWGRRILAG